jgi:hypothetical protein
MCDSYRLLFPLSALATVLSKACAAGVPRAGHPAQRAKLIDELEELCSVESGVAEISTSRPPHRTNQPVNGASRLERE